MTRIAILIASVAFNVASIAARASECISNSDIAASRTRLAATRSLPAGMAHDDRTCRAYAASFYELVTIRQAAANCVRGSDRERGLALLDSEIDAFNDALARCGG
ncbi:hypothetical protein H8B02_12180 [Bradyrhizobium sp. Pear77]|uniref:hypothetical protein n=1 Tax=Bradyrhizobium TaxID=374 RepID=UPI001E502823|nr:MULTISPECIES: hypothetical protein [Bradyrhizobium]MCC8954183.1 hypothetical protein [Bradyrhizobium altum]MCC8963877.1 hypothetical protein [Bradyrhizobium oropedii]